MTSANGAPVKSRRQDSSPMWVNPCGLAAEDFNSDPEIEQLKDFDLVSQIIVQSQTALSHTSLFREDFVKECFKSDFENLHAQWKEVSYDWLPNFPELPKRLGEQLDVKHLEGSSMDEMLLKAYRFLQIFAVALEQIVWDQEENNLPFFKYFREAELKLRAVLCEVQAALVERAVPLGNDVTRDVMAEEYRSTASSATFRNLRDFLILRDYINCLEYVNQLCEYLRTTLPPS
ncbi:PREDICTED: uncharacterized protein LOC107073103 [Polistes dominula]|uniref:Uncharacterized protein LOC107073103 n=1 Tax=Polistes dominula TaxID=743375 RepID=A0ABM1J9A5_POLDO|nr:PREDICTED: uncharacterized protein LOC107073103 [Polistes dominula]